MFKILLTAGALALGITGAAHAAIVTNGSFEDAPGFPFNSEGWGIGSLPGWTNTEGGIEVQTQLTLNLQPDDGLNYIELDGTRNYEISQLVSLLVGDYNLSFAYSPRQQDLGTNGIAFSVGSLLNSSVTGPNVLNMTSVGEWTLFTYRFTVANAGSYTLAFSGLPVSDSFGGLLDNVAIAAVPVPAAGLLLIGALGGLAVLRRRRKTA